MGSRLGEHWDWMPGSATTLYYTLLLKDLGCSSNAARICELYLYRRSSLQARLQAGGWLLSEVVNFVLEPHRLAGGSRWRVFAACSTSSQRGIR